MALLGGAAFVASLAYCAWTYGITWRTPRAPGLSYPALALDTALFLAFAAHHSLTARDSVKARIAAVTGDAGVRTAYVWIASLLFIAVCAAWQPVGGVVYEQAGALGVVHIAIQLAGVVLVVLSVRLIDALELAGLRAASTPRLHTGGPYRLVRHPLYLGWILMVFGTALMTADRLAFAVLSSAYLIAAIPLEERSLGRVFGRRYDEYTRRVRWRVIPYVY